MTRTYYRTHPETGEVERSPVPFNSVDGRMPLFTDRFMEGAHTAEGVDIGSRTKRRDFMRSTGAVDASDYADQWSKAAERRAAVHHGHHDDRAITEAVNKAWETRK